MGYTKFGELLRIIHIKHHEVMGDMAEILGTSTPFLSAVENGKKNVPQNMVNKIVKHYNLSKEEEEELKKAAADSKTQIKIDLKKSDEYQREAALKFARSFDNIDDETAERIIKILEGDE